jgi:hypothetical protein
VRQVHAVAADATPFEWAREKRLIYIGAFYRRARSITTDVRIAAKKLSFVVRSMGRSATVAIEQVRLVVTTSATRVSA